MDYLNRTDAQITADPHWPQRMRQAAQEAYRRAGSALPIVTDGFFLLMRMVPDDNGPQTIAALRRVIRTMDAFSRLPTVERDVLQDIVVDPWRGRVPAYQNRQLHSEQLSALYASDPDLTELAADFAARAKQAAAANQQQADAYNDARNAKVQREADAPALVMNLHNRGFRLDVGADGVLRVFPSSRLTDEDRATLATHASELLAAARAETATIPAVGVSR